MSGFWNYSFLQIHDENGRPLIGARAYFYLGGTTTPITVYKAFALGAVNAHPNPIQTDGFGFFPAVYLDEADGFFRMRITTAQGVVVLDADGIPIIGSGGGGGGGGDNPVDPDSVMLTGDMVIRYGEGLRSGFVRSNGRTIGSATSGASERANSDTQPLFEHLWNADPNLVVVGGRGASALADWSSNKQITLPDSRGRALIGLDDMGNIAANVIPDADDLGWTGGERVHVLTVAEMPSHGHTGTTNEAGHHDHTVGASYTGSGTGSNGGYILPTTNGGSTTSGAGDHSHVLNINAAGGGLGHNNVQPSIAITVYIRL